MRTLGLYLHVPFCRRKCRYCDFDSACPAPGEMERWLAGMERRLAVWGERLRDEDGAARLSTLFVGGGTPSLLPWPLWEVLWKAIDRTFDRSDCVECTVEMNPGTLTPGLLERLRESGVNRVSLGAQAAQPELLRRLGRIHLWPDVERAVAAIRPLFPRFSLDLMFGLPGQRMEDWAETLEAALALSPGHLSCYGLQLEPGTPLADAVAKGALTVPDEDVTADMMLYCRERLAKAGLVRYEISNFAQPGQESLHNLGYWRDTPFLGLGPSAYSAMEIENAWRRWGEPEGLAAWLRADAAAPIWRDGECLSPRERRWEEIMLGLRLREGIAPVKELEEPWKRFCAMGLAEQGPRWRLTDAGMDVQNTLLVELMEAWERH